MNFAEVIEDRQVLSYHYIFSHCIMSKGLGLMCNDCSIHILLGS